MSKVTYLNSHLQKYREEPEIRIDLEDVEALAYYDILVNNENIKVNFDWSYQGGNWYVIDENSLQWVIKNTDRCVSETIYCTGQPNTSSLYIMEKKAGYRTRDWRFSKLVF